MMATERIDTRQRVPLWQIFTLMSKLAFIEVSVWFNLFITGVSILHGVSFAVVTLATQKFFDAVTVGVETGKTMNSAIPAAILLILAMIGSQLLNGLHNFSARIFGMLAEGCIRQKVNHKAVRLLPVVFEEPALLDLVNKAEEGAFSGVWLVSGLTTLLTFYLPYILFMLVYLFLLEPVLAVALLLVFIPLALSQLVRQYVFANLEDEIAPLRRERDYWRKSVGSKETRLLGVFPFFRSLFSDTLRRLNAGRWRAEKKAGLAELGMNVLTLLGYLGVVALFVNALLQNRISVGAFAAVFASIDMMFSLMNEAICQHIGSMAQNFGATKNFARFMKLPERGGTAQTKNGSAIVIESASFRYPNATADSLRNINLTINAGEIIAIVGENGAGKSTLVKLALGLYTPTGGRVMQSGMDTGTADSASLFTNTSAVFQNFQRYKMTLRENVTISAPDDTTQEISPLLAQTGLSVAGSVFPEGEATMLSREFDGVELSGGQWQRVAIARGLYRAHDIIVLDEPTAAIDPVEECNLYRQFAEIAAGKTAIIVTHRLGSAKIADRIIVLDNGSIVESGTHDELMKHKGKYAAMYAAQAKWYERAGE